jgi:hypothetical protein
MGEVPKGERDAMRIADFLSLALRKSVTIQNSFDTLKPDGDKVQWNDLLYRRQFGGSR